MYTTAMTEKFSSYHLKAPESLMKQVDAWRAKQPDLPNRSEAIRRLIQIGLKAN
jgi:metal-responsive CopG/Arc/MetJ family transcriptional regulator